MNKGAAIGSVAAGVGAGAAMMYFLDPQRGARRRAGVADKVTRAARRLPHAARVTAQDTANRAKGIWSDTVSLLRSDTPTDQVLEARVRSKLGRVCSHPHSVHVTARDGNVRLDGVILSRELHELLSCVERIRGVRSVTNELRAYDSPHGIPSLQGGRPRESRFEFMQQNWSPAARVAAGTAGTAAIAYGVARHDPVGIAAAVAGAALLARSATNTELGRLIGVTGGRSAVTVQKSINIDAPPDVVFRLWADFENFPFLMSNVLKVTKTDDGLSHWSVNGPGGVPIEWDAEITAFVENEMIAWKSLDGTAFPNAGYVHFEPNEAGGTELTIRISYNPPGGAVGHALAVAFGADPKSQMDADLMRMKSFLETGQPAADAAQAQVLR